MAVKVAVTKNLVAVKGPQVAVVSGGSGSEGLPGSGNPDYAMQSEAGKSQKRVTLYIILTHFLSHFLSSDPKFFFSLVLIYPLWEENVKKLGSHLQKNAFLGL